MFSKKTGMAKVQAVVSKLLTTVAELQDGIEEIDGELAANREVQDAIKQQNRVLGASRTQASNLARNIEEMLS